MSEEFFYVDSTDQRVGPVSWSVLEQLYQAGTIVDDTLTAPGGAQEWMRFAELRERQIQASLPPVPGSGGAPEKGAKVRRRRKQPLQKVHTAWIIGAALVTLALVVFVAIKLGPGGGGRMMSPASAGKGGRVINPDHVPFEDIADAIEAMPKLHLPIPDPTGENEGAMLIFTGEDSARVRPIPDHPGLFQIDVIRYAVVYDDLPSTLGTRNALTVLLTLGTGFQDGAWVLMSPRGSSHDEIAKPGRRAEKKITEFMPADLATWHGDWIIRHLNGVTPDPAVLSMAAQKYAEREESFAREAAKIEAIRAQGIDLFPQ